MFVVHVYALFVFGSSEFSFFYFRMNYKQLRPAMLLVKSMKVLLMWNTNLTRYACYVQSVYWLFLLKYLT